jgi:hypothetical protein
LVEICQNRTADKSVQRIFIGFSIADKCIFASDLYWFSSKEVSIKISNGVGKEKKLCAK